MMRVPGTSRILARSSLRNGSETSEVWSEKPCVSSCTPARAGCERSARWLGREVTHPASKDLIEYLDALLPRNEVIGLALRKEVPMYPIPAVRELAANALIHQDFAITGTGPMIEVFDDRMEITNPGQPLVSTDRFPGYTTPIAQRGSSIIHAPSRDLRGARQWH